MAEIHIKLFDTGLDDQGRERCRFEMTGLPQDDLRRRKLTKAETYAYKIALFVKNLSEEDGIPQDDDFPQITANYMECKLRYDSLDRHIDYNKRHPIEEEKNAKLDNQSNCPG